MIFRTPRADETAATQDQGVLSDRTPRARVGRVTLAGVAMVLVAVGVGSLNVFRAATQSIAHDEALTARIVLGSWWNLIDGPFLRTGMLPNYHPLYSHLAWLSVTSFGLSELSLRLPSLLAGFVYIYLAVLLVRSLLGVSWSGVAALALLVLDPGVFDFMSAARGYGLGLSMLFLGLFHLIQALADAISGRTPRYQRLVAGGLGLGLAASANLTYVLPGAGIGLAFATCLLCQRRTGTPLWRELLRVVFLFVAPGTIVFLAISYPLLKHVSSGTYYVGADSLVDAARSVIATSLSARVNPILRVVFATPFRNWCAAIAMGAGVVLALSLMATAAREVITQRRSVGPEPTSADLRNRASARILGLGLAATLVLLVGAHRAAGVKYPEGRMAIFVPPLFWLSVVVLVRRLSTYAKTSVSSGRSRAATTAAVAGRWAALTFCALGLAQYLLALDVSMYETWAYDRSTKRFIDVVTQRELGSKRMVRFGITWLFEPSVNFYRNQPRLNWIYPVNRSGPRHECDYYILTGSDVALVSTLDLKPIARDDVAGTVLAVPNRPTR